LIPWSYSLLADFANCPRKAYHKFFARDLPREPPSAAMAKGTAVHTLMEEFFARRTTTTPLPEKWYEFAKPMMEVGGRAEVKLGMDEAGGPAEFFKNPWGRGVIDVLIIHGPVAVIFDWKTGKTREDPRELHCHALLLKANYPDVQQITGAYIWLKEDRKGKSYDLSDTSRVYYANRESVRQMESCQERGLWPETPNPLCGWCPVKQCKFNRSEK
jgi:hypothetical protein